MTMNILHETKSVDTRKFDIANAALNNKLPYHVYRQNMIKQCSPYIDHPMLLTEDQYNQQRYAL